MNDFEGLLSSDYGFKPSGKSAPMSSAKSTSSTSSSTIGPQNYNSTPFNFDIPRSTSSKSTTSSSFLPDDFPNLANFDDVFSSSKKTSTTTHNTSSVNFDSIFGGGGGGGGSVGSGGGREESKFSSLPVFDKPVYDDDDVSSSSNKYEDIFATNSAKKSSGGGGDAFDDLLGNLGKKEPPSAKSGARGGGGGNSGGSSFDDLLPGFGGTTASIHRSSSNPTKKTSSVLDDPFVVLESTSPPVSTSSGIFTDPLDEIGSLNNSGRKKFESSSSRGVFDDIDPLDDFVNSVPPFSAEKDGREKDESPVQTGSRVSGRQTSLGADMGQKSSVTSPERGSGKKMHVDDFGGSPHNVFEMPSVSVDSSRSVPNASSPVYGSTGLKETDSRGHISPEPEEDMGSSDEVWLTVSEIPLFTQPTAAPPPSRPPPPRPARFSRGESGSFPTSNAQRRVNDFSSYHGSNPYFQSPKSAPAGAQGSFASPIDELEEFAMGNDRSGIDENSDVRSGDDFDANSVAAAAAMKEAVDRAEAKFRYARGVRERENVKASRSRESVQTDKDEAQDVQDREFKEGQERLERVRQQRDSEEEEERRRREEEERRRVEKEREEKEREKRRIERERELARQAVERASREARERAAVEARTRAERAAVQKAQAEARERAERAAVQRAQAEARERAAAEAKERAQKAAAEKARAEAREKETRERAAAATRANQQSEPDLESIFGTGSRASSAPRPRANSSDPFETEFKAPPGTTRTPVNSASNIRKASSSTNIVDDLSSIFGPSPSSGDFQDIDGETEDRRRARLERHQRTQERAAKALADKNARDLEVQREQAEKNRIGETLDVEIKRWAAGKEGNLRALLSTLQYVLWPGCGWQPVSLTDLITGASVKKVYRKATLCIHPDKVQQKGATLQQKYVAEKVFDLLKEAWNKFNSEELF